MGEHERATPPRTFGPTLPLQGRVRFLRHGVGIRFAAHLRLRRHGMDHRLSPRIKSGAIGPPVMTVVGTKAVAPHLSRGSGFGLRPPRNDKGGARWGSG
jgi:hypothetical protein